MASHFADRLLDAIEHKRAPVCVGIDPVYSRLPAEIRDLPDFCNGTNSESALDAIVEFSRTVIRTVAPTVPAVKINSAFFERYYGEGVDAYLELVLEARKLGLVVIGDCKRGDVGHTSELLAQSQLADPDLVDLDQQLGPDAVTLHSYLGLDAFKPFLGVCRRQNKGVFALVRTSNESASDIQDFASGAGVTVIEHLAALINTWSQDDGLIGRRGYSCLGAVVAPRKPELARRLRALMSKCIFLVPGYGAQGLSTADIATCFNPDGTGAVVNASRSIIYAFDDPKYEQHRKESWVKAVEAACRDFVADVARAIAT